MSEDNDVSAVAPRGRWRNNDRAIFRTDLRPAGRLHNHAIDETARAFPGTFANRTEIRQFLARICLPASERWAFVVTGKAATTTTLALLFEAEFGLPFTVRARAAGNPNPDVGLHALMWHDVFCTALTLPRPLDSLAADSRVERVAVVRHPETRAVSAFLYLCRSHAEAREDFAGERARMAALFGFDFETMKDTSAGFVRFLEFVQDDLSTNGHAGVNPHWRPQSRLIFPAEYRPTLVGKVEAYAIFAGSLFERLERPAPSEVRHLNPGKRDRAARQALFEDPAAARLVRDIYHDDFASFGYEPS